MHLLEKDVALSKKMVKVILSKKTTRRGKKKKGGSIAKGASSQFEESF